MITKDNNFGEEEVNFMPHTNFTTLCYIETEDSYLMLHRVKKEGDMNRDKWLGVGGHFEKGESPEECLLREVKEETGLTLLRWRFRGLVTFVSDRWPEEYMCLYTADRYEGTIGDCREGQLEWVKKDQIRELSLWEGDLIFFEGTMGEDVGGITHVGLYVGDNVMIHCGNPIAYADLTRSYWQQHFYGFGRIPYDP